MRYRKCGICQQGLMLGENGKYLMGCEHFPAEVYGSIPVLPQGTAHIPAPKLEDFHAFRRLCCDLSRLQGDQDNLQAELDQVGHKSPLPLELQPVSLLPLAERNRKGIRKAIDSLMKRT